MGEYRDHRGRRTPPVGVRQQIADPLTEEDWDADTTPPPENVPEVLALVGRRQKQTQQTQQNTLDRVDTLRVELGDRIDRINDRVDQSNNHLGRVEGKMDILTDVVQRSLDAQSAIHVSRVTASIEVEKTSEIAVIEEDKARSAFPRELLIKVIAVAGPLVAAAITAGLLKC